MLLMMFKMIRGLSLALGVDDDALGDEDDCGDDDDGGGKGLLIGRVGLHSSWLLT